MDGTGAAVSSAMGVATGALTSAQIFFEVLQLVMTMAPTAVTLGLAAYAWWRGYELLSVFAFLAVGTMVRLCMVLLLVE